MRHLTLAAAILVLAACGPERSATTPSTGKGGTSAATARKAEPAATTPAPAVANGEPAVPAADAKPATEAPTAKAINTICPVTGLAVDPSIPPIEVLVEVVHPPRLLLIGVSDADAGKRVAANPERFAAAASSNRVARDTRAPAAGAGQR